MSRKCVMTALLRNVRYNYHDDSVKKTCKWHCYVTSCTVVMVGHCNNMSRTVVGILLFRNITYSCVDDISLISRTAVLMTL